MKQTFLHVSDLHYRPNWPEESELVLSKFVEDAKEQIKQYINPILLFSGDLVHAGGPPVGYEAFLNKVGTAFDEIGIPKERRVCVPGNHDINRVNLKPYLTMQKGTLAEITDEESFNREVVNLGDLILKKNFSSYVAAEATFAGFTACQDMLGGKGWELNNEIGIYCMNSALCSFGGSEDLSTGEKISDKERLHIDTRSLHQWIQTTNSTIRILMMHHPLSWLSNWAAREIESVSAEKFRIIISGHVHEGSSVYSRRGTHATVYCTAPALFTRKKDDLGYSLVTLDTESAEVEIAYRQKTKANTFVAGTILAENNTGIKRFHDNTAIIAEPDVSSQSAGEKTTRDILEEEFLEACTSYSSKRIVWVARDLSITSESAQDARGKEAFIAPSELAQQLRSCVIRAPKEFGLTSLGRFIALEHHKHFAEDSAILQIDLQDIPHHRQGVIEYVVAKCVLLRLKKEKIAGFILDNWVGDQRTHKIWTILRTEFVKLPFILLQGLEDFREIANTLAVSDTEDFERFYLCSLRRTRIRELVSSYMASSKLDLDEDLVTRKIIEDIDALNIHRTPLNCLLMLTLVERAFDDSPVNRTEVIGKVLYFLFHEFDQIPRYATRPDLKDCEYALGYLCEWMIRSNRRSFSRSEFFDKVREYTQNQLISLDIDVLFSFLATENILLRRGNEFGFRLTYWLHFFAAHRMHHDKNFATFILTDVLYAKFPEVIEFYTGIDRRRNDAVEQLTADLQRMDAEFLARTGIVDDFNPLGEFSWAPGAAAVERLQKEVVDSIQESALPTSVKDAIADRGYDCAKPYHQEVNRFIIKSSVQEMIQAMKGAARALRNSDHVSPVAKMALLEAIMKCWVRVCQIIVVISPMLAADRSANFEGVGFCLNESFDCMKPGPELWKGVMTAIVDNVVRWHQQDIFSKKLGALFTNFVSAHHGSLPELLVILVLIKQRAPGWDAVVRSYIVRSHKNSFYLYKVHRALWNEFRFSFASEAIRQELRSLAAMSVAKHETGSKHPNLKLVARMAEAMDRTISSDNVDSTE